MFNQRTKSIRITKTDSSSMNGGEYVDANNKSSSSSSPNSKGLLSFNTSNLTKLFKNPTNFVQSTFGSGNNSNITSPFSNQSNSISHEQSFTIPSYRKHQNASHNNVVKKERDILSTPVLIAPVLTTSSASTIVSSLSASSTQSVALDTSNYANISNGNVTAAFVQMRTSVEKNSLDQKIVKKNQFLSSPKAFSPNNINRKAISSESITKTTNSFTPSISTASTSVANTISLISTKSYINSSSKNSTSTPVTATIAPFSVSNVVKTKSNDRPTVSRSNDSILFETMKTNKNTASMTLGSLETSKKVTPTTNSILLSKHEHRKKQSECNDEKLSKFENTCLLENDNLTEFKMAKASTSSSPSLKTVSTTFDNDNARQKAIFNSLMKNDLQNSTETEISLSNFSCNNNMDYNVQECIRYMESENPFEQSAMKLNYLQQISMDAIAAEATRKTSSSSLQNVFKTNGEEKCSNDILYLENCISLPIQSTKQSNGDTNNYYQQDNNENLIALAKMAKKHVNDNTIDDNDDTVENVHSNNNDSTNNNESDNVDDSTKDDCVQKLTSNSVTNSQQNILLSNYNQSFYLPRATELHDIQENEDDDDIENDDENAFINRYGDNWSMSKNPLYGIKGTNNYQPKITNPSSFAAAASAIQSSRNPFLQLMTHSSGASNTENERCLLSLERSPCTATIASTLFDNSIVTSIPTSNNNINNVGTCTAFSADDTHKIIASLASVANLFGNLTAQASIDCDASSNGSSNIAIDGSNSNLSMMAMSDLMPALQTLLKENGNEYITQFLQVNRCL